MSSFCVVFGVHLNALLRFKADSLPLPPRIGWDGDDPRNCSDRYRGGGGGGDGARGHDGGDDALR